MKLTINGSPLELAALLTHFAGKEVEKKESPLLTVIGKAVEENRENVLTKVEKLADAIDTASPAETPAPEKTTKTRRTKAQIAADNFKDPADQDEPALIQGTVDPLPEKSGIDREEMKDFVLQRVEADPANGAKIRAELTKMGVSRAGELKDDQLNPFWVFLQAL